MVYSTDRFKNLEIKISFFILLGISVCVCQVDSVQFKETMKDLNSSVLGINTSLPSSVRVTPRDNLEIEKLELEVLDKAVRFEKDYPGQPNPYKEFLTQIKNKVVQDSQSPPRKSSWFRRHFWILAIGALATIILVSAPSEHT